jgi:hypothetical protein
MLQSQNPENTIFYSNLASEIVQEKTRTDYFKNKRINLIVSIRTKKGGKDMLL